MNTIAIFGGRSGTYSMPLSTYRCLIAYCERGIPAGNFLRAVLSNDLAGAVGRADMENRACLSDIVRWCAWELPADIWGSEAKVDNYLAKRLEEQHAAIN